MLERVLFFIWQLVILITIALVYILILFIEGRRNKNNLNKVSWVCGNKKRSIFYYILVVLIGAPVIEELIFRAPLILFFEEINSQAWIFIILSVTVFALVHLKNPSAVVAIKIREKYNNGELETDELDHAREETSKELTSEEKRMGVIGKVVQVTLSLAIGTVAGYWGIKTQSLWTPVLIHAAANIFLPVILPVIMMILVIILRYVMLAVSALWYEIEWRLFLK